MLELNLNLHYNPLFWQTAVLNSNAGTIDLGDDTEKQQNKDYGKVAKAVSELQQQGIKVDAPLINTAGYSFIPDVENNRIIFSLKAIVGLNEDTTHEIIEKRPFSSFEDFYQRMYVEGENLKPVAFVNLIKAGAFTDFEPVEESMKKFVFREIKPKDKLNGQNMRSIIRMGLLNEPKYKKYQDLFEFRNTVNKQVEEKVTSPKDKLLFIKPNQVNYLTETFGSDIILKYNDKAQPIISQKELKKEYDKLIEPLYEEINTPEFIKKYNIALFMEEWVKRTGGGNQAKWTMDALVYYPNEHELDKVKLPLYNVVNYFELSPNPEPIGINKWRGREYPQYEIQTIAGTVIDKNNNKHTVTLLTKEGVVTCKLYAGAYAHYNKEIKEKGKRIEESWFKRGTLLMVSGYRREDQWIVRKDKYQEHSINKITNIKSNGELELQLDRYYVE